MKVILKPFRSFSIDPYRKRKGFPIIILSLIFSHTEHFKNTFDGSEFHILTTSFVCLKVCILIFNSSHCLNPQRYYGGRWNTPSLTLQSCFLKSNLNIPVQYLRFPDIFFFCGTSICSKTSAQFELLRELIVCVDGRRDSTISEAIAIPITCTFYL